jgi:radical SAM-linked protein
MDRAPVLDPPVAAVQPARSFQPVKYRLRFRKERLSRFVGHLDLVDILVRALRRAGVQLAYSQGYHPMPKVELPAPLPLGVEGREEWMEFQAAPLDRAGLMARLRGLLPAGLSADHLFLIPPSSPPLSALSVQVYEVGLTALSQDGRAAVAARLAEFTASSQWPVARLSKGAAKTYDLKARVRRVDMLGPRIEIHLAQGGFMDLVHMLCPGPEREDLSLARIRLDFPSEGPPGTAM